MKYHELTLEKNVSKKRLGRGISAGQGKTAGRGTKGQKSRAGYSKKPGFAGGSNPLMKKLPKLPGFKSFKRKNQLIVTSQLNNIKATSIDAHTLKENNLIVDEYHKVKLLFDDKVTKKINLKINSASKKAISSIEEKGGSYVSSTLKRPKSSAKESK